jgi:hypothetical protein
VIPAAHWAETTTVPAVGEVLRRDTYSFALKNIEPAIVNTLYTGIGPMAVLVLSTFRISMAMGRLPSRASTVRVLTLTARTRGRYSDFTAAACPVGDDGTGERLTY